MHGFPEQNLRTLFSTEQHCVSYLFQKRWPRGFSCPFCGMPQKEMAPAHTVVCRYCRKQTSITAHTLMHGSKKSLIGWMRVSWQFCKNDQGISARELQRLMELSCYHTAWSWLQKIRLAAALAESTPCGGKVVFEVVPLPISASQEKPSPVIGIALELQHDSTGSGRVRFAVLDSTTPECITATIQNLIATNAILLIPKTTLPKPITDLPCHYLQLESAENDMGKQLYQKAELWLMALFRGAINRLYLQSYLDEFSFRYNTATWANKLDIFDHLLTGLVTDTQQQKTPKNPLR